jgi:hypothetical protein
MDCSVCEIRSSIGYCEDCNTLLCDECHTKCDVCAAMLCPDHVNMTRGGRSLCLSCYEERNARKKARHDRHGRDGDDEHVPTGLADLTGEEDEELEADEHAVLTASARKPVVPWKLSLNFAVVGLVAIIVLIAVPADWRFAPIPLVDVFPLSIFVLVLPVWAFFWAGYGLTKPEFIEDFQKCFYGLALGFVVALTAIVMANMERPAALDREGTLDQAGAEIDEEPTTEMLDQRRNSILDKYR